MLFDRSSQTHFIILIPLSTLLDGNIEEMWLKKKGNLTCLKIEVFYILLTKTFFFVFPSYKPLFKLREVRTNMDVKTGKKKSLFESVTVTKHFMMKVTQPENGGGSELITLKMSGTTLKLTSCKREKSDRKCSNQLLLEC